MRPISTIVKTLQKAIDLVVKAEDNFEDRGRSRLFPPRRTSSTRRITKSTSNSRGRSRTESSISPTPVGGRNIHLIKDLPPGSDRRVFRPPSTKRHRGRLRPLQE